MNTKRLLPIWLLAILLLGAVGCRQADNAADQTPDVAAAAATPVSGAVDAGQVSAEGKITPLRAADLAFLTGGTVADVLVSEGQTVAAGDPLIRLDATVVESGLRQAEAGLQAAQANLSAAQAQLALAQAQKQSAEAAVAAAEAQLALVEAGARPEQIAAAERGVAAATAGVAQAAAERDAALNVSDARVRAAEAQLAAAESRYTALQETYDTIVTTCVTLPDGSEVCPLLGAPEENVRLQLAAAEASRRAAQLALEEARAGATAAQRQTADAAVAAAAAQQDVAEAQLALAQAGARPEQIEQAAVGLEQARLGVTQVEAAAKQAEAAVTQAEAAVQAAQASVDAANTALARMTLTAPFAGAVGDVLVEVGELVAPGITVAGLADVTGWLVETTDLVELDVVYIEPGQTAEVTLDALPGEVLRGTVVEIAQVPELTRGDVTYRVRVDLDDYPDLPLRWGMTALATIDTN